MDAYKNGKFVGIATTQDQRVCDTCGTRFLTGVIRFVRATSREAYCDKCDRRRSRA